MEHPTIKKITGWLTGLCILLLVCDILLLPLTPAMAYFRLETAAEVGLDGLLATFRYDFDDGLGNLISIILAYAWRQPHTAVTSAFLLVCGVCAAVILLQGIRILENLSVGLIFSEKNAVCLKRAAAAGFLISAAAAVRTVCTASWKSVSDALFSYTALFVPLFLMVGLLFLIMSGLFSRAAEMKEENDLTI